MNHLTTELPGPQQRGDTMKSHLSKQSLTVALCAALILAAAGCGGAATAPSAAPAAAPATAAVGAARHAPHRATLTGDASCSGTDVHQKHLSRFSCDTCHPTGGTFGFTKAYRFPRGTTTTAGTIVVKTATAPTTCTVACHYPLGQAAKSITWTPGLLACTDCHAPTGLPSTHPALDPLATASDCLGCHTTGQHLSGAVALVGHDAAWMNQQSPTFHAVAAEQGLAKCQQCHGQDLATGAANAACGQCHDQNLPVGAASWKTNCVMCHGGTDNPTGAPPRVTWGRDADAVRIGAHTTHVTGSALAPPFDCGVCHPKPADALSANHVGLPTARVVFSGTASFNETASPSWDRTAATCSSTYCHGATLLGGTHKNPVWTAGVGEAACGNCHGVPPPSPHPVVTGGLTACVACHSLTMDAAGNVIPPSQGGKHLDGLIESTAGHASSWMDQASAGFHAFSANRNLVGCTSCHGADLSGGSAGIACTSCHASTFRSSCTSCHGDKVAGTAAPPRTTWGNSGDAIRVGAHTAHLSGGGVTQPIACETCHVVPTDALSPGHADGATASLTWSGMAVSGGVAPQWNRSNATCSAAYCHGDYSGTYSYTAWDYALDQPVQINASYVGVKATPAWTDGPATCASCHGNPPQGVGYWHAVSHGGGTQCELCHPSAATTAAGNIVTDLRLHINGVVEVVPQWKTTCRMCH